MTERAAALSVVAQENPNAFLACLRTLSPELAVMAQTSEFDNRYAELHSLRIRNGRVDPVVPGVTDLGIQTLIVGTVITWQEVMARQDKRASGF